MYYKVLKLCIFVLIIFTAGFILGKKEGKKESIKEGEIFYNIKLKEKLLKEGLCPICKNELKESSGRDTMIEKNQEV
ncbi:MAG: hypothetical protein ACPLRZ_04045 [Thermovenabulum sp.]|uniref:hypothetical protein n=1 Tax=Thermovenabulum sp. TaxID=3100335 RepID=UPI003C7CC002